MKKQIKIMYCKHCKDTMAFTNNQCNTCLYNHEYFEKKSDDISYEQYKNKIINQLKNDMK